jgi:GNAT superfamily N-acetyltransferase
VAETLARAQIYGMRVRTATPEDAGSIAEFAGQLGYPSTVDEVSRRLAEINDSDEHAVLVADEGALLLGWIHLFVSRSLVADTRVDIVGLVVAESHRGQGIGRLLMKDAERWARRKGCGSIRLHSNVARSGAHAFYEKLGYQMIKLQKAFRKDLSGE